MGTHEDIMFYAFRYALGRHTYAVSDVARHLIANKGKISGRTRTLIAKEIAEHLADTDPNEWETDRRYWEAVERAMNETT